jgi:hypothetical protein
MKIAYAIILIILAIATCVFAQSLEEKARARFEAEGGANLSKGELILLVHEYKRSWDWEIQMGMKNNVRVAQLEVVVQNLVNDLMAVYWHRDMLKMMRDEEAKLNAEILRLKGERNSLQRQVDDLKRTSL